MLTRSTFSGLVCLLFAGTAHAASVPGAPSAALVQSPSLAVATFGRDSNAEPAFDAGAQVDQGFNLIQQGKQAQAVKLFDRIIASADQRLGSDPRQRLCRSDVAAGRAAPEQVVVVDDALCDAHFGKGFALIDLGRGDQAEAELLAATQMAPGNAHFANEYAELFKSRREWQKSYDLFARAWAVVDKNKTSPDATLAARALRGMGYNKIEMGNLGEAERLFRQSQEYEPGNDAAKLELAYIARKLAIGS